MASEVDICNAALTLIGEPTIDSLTDPNNAAAVACNEAYTRLRDAELRAHRWGFAIKRAQLAATATTPLFGKANYFPVPSDFLRRLELDPYYQSNLDDDIIENTGTAVAIASDSSSPLSIRYIARITDPNKFDSLFNEALSAKIARTINYKITQSQGLNQQLTMYYEDAIAEARRINAIEKPPVVPVADPWITVRS